MYSFARRLTISTPFLGCILLLAGTANAGEMIYACAHKNSGDLRVTSAPGQCLNSEYELSWEDGLELGQQVNELLGRVAAIEAALGVLNEAPSVTAGDDQTILLSMVANFSGDALDDGLLEPLSFLWERVAGPGTVWITNPDSLLTSVTFSTVGDYTFRLSVFDGAITVSDELLVIVYPDNNPPVIVKDSDPLVVPARRWRQSGYWTLSCLDIDLGVTATDDRLPDEELSVSWTIDDTRMYGGFQTYNDLTAGFAASPPNSAEWPLNIASRLRTTGYPPSYLPQYLLADLSLATNDGYHAVNDTLQVKCDIAASETPTAYAGEDQTVTGIFDGTLGSYKCENIAFVGTAEDDGLPEPLRVSWTGARFSPGYSPYWDAYITFTPGNPGEATATAWVRYLHGPVYSTPPYVTFAVTLTAGDGWSDNSDTAFVTCQKPQ